MSNNTIGVIALLVVLSIALMGGNKGVNKNGIFYIGNIQNQNRQVSESKEQIENLKKIISEEEKKENQSAYKGLVSLQYVNRDNDPSREYVTIRTNYSATSTISITGWKIKSLRTNMQVEIPQGTYLFFSGMDNASDNIMLVPGDIAYIISGISPIGVSFKTNKCSGYLTQFQTFVPYISQECPTPRDEDLTVIPNRVENDDCLDYIDSFPRCKVQIGNLPVNWGYECKQFIQEKLNYASCINTHKSDKDFYRNEWRIYLKRSSSIWGSRKEVLVLYDNKGKVVDMLKY